MDDSADSGHSIGSTVSRRRYLQTTATGVAAVAGRRGNYTLDGRDWGVLGLFGVVTGGLAGIAEPLFEESEE